jgi:hypothetical protein
MSAKAACGVFLGVLFLLVFYAAVLPGIPPLHATATMIMAAGSVLWKGRTFEVLIQGVIILAGVIAILLLLGSDRSREILP